MFDSFHIYLSGHFSLFYRGMQGTAGEVGGEEYRVGHDLPILCRRFPCDLYHVRGEKSQCYGGKLYVPLPFVWKSPTSM